MTVLGMQHESDWPIEQSLRRGFVEREPMDPVVATARPVERRTQPADLDRFHLAAPRRVAGAVDGMARILHTNYARCNRAAHGQGRFCTDGRVGVMHQIWQIWRAGYLHALAPMR
jgi:hypothetical protein